MSGMLLEIFDVDEHGEGCLTRAHSAKLRKLPKLGCLSTLHYYKFSHMHVKKTVFMSNFLLSHFVTMKQKHNMSFNHVKDSPSDIEF